MRRYYLDNARYTIVLLVILYHIAYLLNSVGVITNVAIQGIPEVDVILYVLYPWFMVALFVIAGSSARFALDRYVTEGKSIKQFLQAKCKNILLPSIAYTFVVGWSTGWVTNQYNDMFAGNGDIIPGFLKYLIYCFAGIGPLWFCHVLMLCFLIVALIRKVDKHDILYKAGSKVNLVILLLMFIPLWGAAQFGTMPVVEIYRIGIYTFAFLIGYEVLAHQKIEQLLKKYAALFIVIAIVLGVIYTMLNYGTNYAELKSLNMLLTNAYAWFGTLAILSIMKRTADKKVRFTEYMRTRSFSFYVLHYPLQCLTAYLLDKYIAPPAALMYLSLLVITIIFLPILSLLVRKTPLLKTLLLGE